MTRASSWIGIIGLAAGGLFACLASAADYTPFAGEKSTWHEGFERYDYLLDVQTLAIEPFQRPADERFNVQDPPPGKRRCVVVVPRQPAAGNPWSWRGCYWDHQPQTEIELLRRGYHVAYISANAQLKPDKNWEAWHTWLTEQHGLAKKPVFVGMSRGGEYAYSWSTQHPDKVAAIYADNPGVNADVLARLGDLARADVPILHVCGSIDPLLGRSSAAIENIYRQHGGRISVILKEGAGHHPHSLRDPRPIADFLAQSFASQPNPPPAYLAGRITRASFYSIANQLQESSQEGTYLTCRGPLFRDCYDRYSFELPGVEGAIQVIAPEKAAAGQPWVYRADPVNHESAVDLALLGEGFHIVTGPVPYNADGPSLPHWDVVYGHLVKHGFAKKPVLAGAGGAAGEAYAWAIAHPDQVACLYAENPLLRATMTKAQPLDRLETLAKAGVPILHVCGSLDPRLASQTRVAEKRYQELGGELTVLLNEGVGAYPAAPRDLATVVKWIVKANGK